jgi:hypothetical protein
MRTASRTQLNWTFILIWTMLGIEIFSMSILPSFWLPIIGGVIFGTSAWFCYIVTRGITDEGSPQPESNRFDRSSEADRRM